MYSTVSMQLFTVAWVWFGLVPFDLSASVTSRHHRKAIYAYVTQWVRVEIGLNKILLRSTDRKIFLVKKKE